MEFRATLDHNATYDLQGRDQMDWNKLTGISYCLFTSHKNSAMIGWRYCIDSNLFELNAYYHIDGVRTYTETLVQVQPGEEFSGSIRLEDGTVITTINDVTHAESFPKLRGIRRRISSWFGGNRPAPNNIHFELNTSMI